MKLLQQLLLDAILAGLFYLFWPDKIYVTCFKSASLQLEPYNYELRERRLQSSVHL